MQPDKRHILWEQGDHPSVELLEQYHGGTLPNALHHQLERHLLDCDLCSDARRLRLLPATRPPRRPSPPQSAVSWVDGDTGTAEDLADVVAELVAGTPETETAWRAHPSGTGTMTVNLAADGALDAGSFVHVAGSSVLLVVNGGSGNNNVTGSPFADRLDGNGGGDTLNGGAGNDILDGGAGPDKLRGGTGDDTYIVDGEADQITENAGEGADTVWVAATYTLGANLENLVLAGTGAIDGIGNALANAITGNSAANLLNGGAGADTMTGNGGDDTYFVDNVGDQAIEAAGGGLFDQVRSSVSYALGDHVEVGAQQLQRGGGEHTGGHDGTIRTWYTASGAAGGIYRAHQGNVNAIVIARGENSMFSCADDGKIALNLQVTTFLLPRIHQNYVRGDMKTIQTVAVVERRAVDTSSRIWALNSCQASLRRLIRRR